VARNSFVISGIFSIIFFGFFGMIGVYARSRGLPASQYIALEVIHQNVTGVSHWLATTAFFSAVMSTSDTFLNVTSLAFAKLTIFNKQGSLESNAAQKLKKSLSRVSVT
jgi:Na+/proline symporter